MTNVFSYLIFFEYDDFPTHFLAVQESLSNNVIHLIPESDRLMSLPLAEDVYDLYISVYGVHNWQFLEQFLRENNMDSPGYSFSSIYGRDQYQTDSIASLEVSENPFFEILPYTFHGTLPSIISFLRTFKPVPIDVKSIDGMYYSHCQK